MLDVLGARLYGPPDKGICTRNETTVSEAEYGKRIEKSMEIATLLRPDAVFSGLRAASKKQVLQELARRAADLLSAQENKHSEREILEVLQDRERLGTTGVGHGIAIPHGKLKGMDQVFGMFARLEHPIDFESIDEEPVDLIFVLLAPETAGADHLKALARVSRLLRDQGICAKLRGTQSADALYVLLTQASAEHSG